MALERQVNIKVNAAQAKQSLSDITSSLKNTGASAVNASRSFSTLQQSIVKNGNAIKTRKAIVDQSRLATQELINKLREESNFLKLSAKDQVVYNATKKAGANATRDQIAEILKLDRAINRSKAAQNQAANATAGVNKSLKAAGRSAGQAGIQIQQLVGQIQGGQSPLVAFSQQSADLGFVLGVPLIGAITSIAAVIAGALLPSLFDSKKAAGEFSDEIIKAVGSVEKLTQAQRELAAVDLKKRLKEQEKSYSELEERLAKLNKEIAFFSRGAIVGGAISDPAKNRINALSESAEDLEAKMILASAKIKNTSDEIAEIETGATSATNAFNDLNKSLADQIAIASRSGVEQKVLAAQIRLGAGATQEQKDAVAAQVRQLFRLEEAQKEALKNERERLKLAKSSLKSFEKEESQTDKIIEALEEQYSLLGLNNEEKQKQVLLSRLGADATAADALAVINLVDVINTETRALERQTDVVQGVSDGFKKYADEALGATEEIAKAAESSAKSLEDAFVNAAKTGKLSFSDMADSILEDLLRIQLRQNVTGPLAAALSGFDFGSLLGFGANAKGGAYGNGVKYYANGGVPSLSQFSNSVVSKPTMFASGAGVMGEAGPEAILPLTRTASGNLGVEAKSSGVMVNIINNSSGEVEQSGTQERTGPSGEKILEVTITDVVNKQIGSGAFDKSLKSGFGLSRQGF